jgi:hexokinase
MPHCSCYFSGLFTGQWILLKLKTMNNEPLIIYTIKYHAGTYSGTTTVVAEDDEQAIAKVKKWVSQQMTAPMYSEGYKIIARNPDN